MKNKFNIRFVSVSFVILLAVLNLSACSQITPVSRSVPAPASKDKTSVASVPTASDNLSPSITVVVDQTIRADKSFDGKEVNMTTGGSLQVSLDSNPTTGFKWELTGISNASVLEKVSNIYDTPMFKVKEGTEPRVGVGGMEFWNFKALTQGRSTLSMEYSQPWDGGTKGARKFSLTVVVQ